MGTVRDNRCGRQATGHLKDRIYHSQWVSKKYQKTDICKEELKYELISI